MKEGWKSEKLGDVLTVIRGSSPRPIKNFITDDEDGVNWIKIGDVGENETFVTSTKQKITKLGAEIYRFVDVGDFIFSNSMSFGRAYIMKIPGYIHDGWFSFKLPENIDQYFLWYLFKSPNLYNQIQKLASGAIVQNVSGDLIKKAILPIPPLPEQQKIVEILDTAFELIDQAKSNIEKNIQNAKELFQSKLNEVFLQKGDGWGEKPLEKVAKTASGGTPLKSHEEYYENGNIPWLLSGEVNNRSITECRKFITQKGLENSSARIFPKDSVLVAMYGATAGQVGILRFEAASNQAVCAIFPNENFIVDFLYYNFLFKKSELIGKAVGNAQPNISQIKIKETVVAIVDLKTQQRIVEQLDQLSAQTEILQKKYFQKLANLEELKKSILEKAFKGELV